MSPMHSPRALTGALPTHRVIDGDRFLGATVLSLVLGIWVTLALNGVGSAEPEQSQRAPSSQASGAALPVHPVLASHPQQR